MNEREIWSEFQKIAEQVDLRLISQESKEMYNKFHSKWWVKRQKKSKVKTIKLCLFSYGTKSP